MNGKGDTPRPLAVDPEIFEANWTQTFEAEQKPEPRPLETLGDPEE